MSIIMSEVSIMIDAVVTGNLCIKYYVFCCVNRPSLYVSPQYLLLWLVMKMKVILMY